MLNLYFLAICIIVQPSQTTLMLTRSERLYRDLHDESIWTKKLCVYPVVSTRKLSERLCVFTRKHVSIFNKRKFRMLTAFWILKFGFSSKNFNLEHKLFIIIPKLTSCSHREAANFEFLTQIKMHCLLYWRQQQQQHTQ